LSGNGAHATIAHQDPSDAQPDILRNVTTYKAPPYSGPPYPDNPTGPTNGSGTSAADKNDPAWKTAYPSVLYMPGETHPLDASDFEPAHGAFTGGAFYKAWMLANPTDGANWHYITGGTPTSRGNLVGTMGQGVYWFDGDVVLPDFGSDISGIS